LPTPPLGGTPARNWKFAGCCCFPPEPTQKNFFAEKILRLNIVFMIFLRLLYSDFRSASIQHSGTEFHLLLSRRESPTV